MEALAPRRVLLARPAALALAMILGALIPGAATAGPPGSTVAGHYIYYVPGGREVTLHASNSTGSPTGTWTWTNLVTDHTISGPITCLVVDGADAWLAGPTADGSLAAFLHLQDGASGAPDDAVTWIVDPGQTLADMEAWCLGQNTEVGLFEIVNGNVTIQ